MSGLHGRVRTLERQERHAASCRLCGGEMDPILAEMSIPELLSLANFGKPGRRPTAEDEATWRRFWDRLTFAGFVLS